MDHDLRNLLERAKKRLKPSDLARYPDKYGCSAEHSLYNEWLNGAQAAEDLNYPLASIFPGDYCEHEFKQLRVAAIAYLIDSAQTVDHNCLPLCEMSGFLSRDDIRQKTFEPDDYPIILELLRAIHAQQPENDYRDVYLAAHIELFEKLVQAPQTK